MKGIFHYIFKRKNILEFDLKNFFPTVRYDGILSVLRSYGISELWALWSVCQVGVEINPPTSLSVPDWTNPQTPIITHKSLLDLLLHKNEPEYRQVNKDKGVPMGYALSPILAGIVLQRVISYIKEKFGFTFLVYADDGLIGWNSSFTYEEVLAIFNEALKPYGVEVNLDKSRLLKHNNKWISIIKFLGVVYDPFKDNWYSQTRKGKSLTLDLSVARTVSKEWINSFFIKQLFETSAYHKLFTWYPVSEAEYNKAMVTNKRTWHVHFQSIVFKRTTLWFSFITFNRLMVEWLSDLFHNKLLKSLCTASLTYHNVIRTKYLGTIMSRMYIGSWNSNIKQDFSLKWSYNSYMEKVYEEDNDLITSLHVPGLILSVFTATTVTYRLLAKALDRIDKWNRDVLKDSNKIWEVLTPFALSMKGKTYIRKTEIPYPKEDHILWCSFLTFFPSISLEWILSNFLITWFILFFILYWSTKGSFLFPSTYKQKRIKIRKLKRQSLWLRSFSLNGNNRPLKFSAPLCRERLLARVSDILNKNELPPIKLVNGSFFHENGMPNWLTTPRIEKTDRPYFKPLDDSVKELAIGRVHCLESAGVMKLLPLRPESIPNTFEWNGNWQDWIDAIVKYDTNWHQTRKLPVPVFNQEYFKLS